MVGMLDLLHHCHLLSKHFCLQLFFPKDSVSLVFAKLSDSVRWPHGRQQRENVWNLGLQIAKTAFWIRKNIGRQEFADHASNQVGNFLPT